MMTSTEKPIPATNRKLLFIALLVVLLAAAAAGLWYLQFAYTSGRSLLPPCLFHSITGLYCTGCGMTRALHYFMQGQFYQGFRMNPLAVLSAPFLLWALLLTLYRLIMGKSMPNIPSWAPWAILAVILVYTVARNLPWEPFSWLAPTQLPWVR
jgi:hypothetical protein